MNKNIGIRDLMTLYGLDSNTQKELEQWYNHVLNTNTRYVVFTEDSYVLALICEIITEKQMEDTNNKEFITEAALLLRIKEIVEYYKKYHELPSILICDGVLTNSIKVNQILEDFENELFKILSDEYEISDIYKMCQKAIQIYSYINPDAPKLLLGRYESNNNYIRRTDSKEYNQLLYNISRVKCIFNITNNCYIYTQYLSDSKMESIKDSLIHDGFIYTSYCEFSKQYSKHIYIENENAVQLILSLRISKNHYMDGYRIKPFIFLPNMDKKETSSLINKLSEMIPPEYVHLLKDWEEIKGMQSLNELITFILSNVILSEFNRKYDIEVIQEDKEYEIIKLARNYNWCNFKKTVNMLNDLLTYNKKTSIHDLANIFKTCKIERIIMKSPQNTDVTISQNEKFNIQKRLENYFYNTILKSEKVVYKIRTVSYSEDNFKLLKRNIRGCAFTIADLNKGYSKIQSQYCMAYLLHMVDVSYISISSYVTNNLNVVGYAQVISAEYLSILIRTLRNNLYNRMLHAFDCLCKYERQDFYPLLKEFGRKNGINEKVIHELTNLFKDLKEIGQSPKDWSGNYLWSISFDKESVYNDISLYMKKQSDLLKECLTFFRDKFPHLQYFLTDI